MYLRKSNKKTAAFSCQRFKNLHPGLPGSQSLNLEVVRSRFKTQYLSQVIVLTNRRRRFYSPIGIPSSEFQIFLSVEKLGINYGSQPPGFAVPKLSRKSGSEPQSATQETCVKNSAGATPSRISGPVPASVRPIPALAGRIDPVPRGMRNNRLGNQRDSCNPFSAQDLTALPASREASGTVTWPRQRPLRSRTTDRLDRCRSRRQWPGTPEHRSLDGMSQTRGRPTPA